MLWAMSATAAGQLPTIDSFLEWERLDTGFEHQITYAGYLPDGTPTSQNQRFVAHLGGDYRPLARLHLVDRAGHTYEVGHPFKGPSPQLREALDRTGEHLRLHLEP